MGKFLSREQILEAKDIQHEAVAVPEWGGTVLVWGMTGMERDAFEDAILGERNEKGRREVSLANFRSKLAVYSVKDAEGKRLFSEKDIAALGAKSAAALDRIASVAQRLSGISEKDVGELVKNLGSGQSGDSGSS